MATFNGTSVQGRQSLVSIKLNCYNYGFYNLLYLILPETQLMMGFIGAAPSAGRPGHCTGPLLHLPLQVVPTRQQTAKVTWGSQVFTLRTYQNVFRVFKKLSNRIPTWLVGYLTVVRPKKKGNSL